MSNLPRAPISSRGNFSTTSSSREPSNERQGSPVQRQPAGRKRASHTPQIKKTESERLQKRHAALANSLAKAILERRALKDERSRVLTAFLKASIPPNISREQLQEMLKPVLHLISQGMKDFLFTGEFSREAAEKYLDACSKSKNVSEGCTCKSCGERTSSDLLEYKASLDLLEKKKYQICLKQFKGTMDFIYGKKGVFFHGCTRQGLKDAMEAFCLMFVLEEALGILRSLAFPTAKDSIFKDKLNGNEKHASLLVLACFSFLGFHILTKELVKDEAVKLLQTLMHFGSVKEFNISDSVLALCLRVLKGEVIDSPRGERVIMAAVSIFVKKNQCESHVRGARMVLEKLVHEEGVAAKVQFSLTSWILNYNELLTHEIKSFIQLINAPKNKDINAIRALYLQIYGFFRTFYILSDILNQGRAVTLNTSKSSSETVDPRSAVQLYITCLAGKWLKDAQEALKKGKRDLYQSYLVKISNVLSLYAQNGSKPVKATKKPNRTASLLDLD